MTFTIVFCHFPNIHNFYKHVESLYIHNFYKHLESFPNSVIHFHYTKHSKYCGSLQLHYKATLQLWGHSNNFIYGYYDKIHPNEWQIV